MSILVNFVAGDMRNAQAIYRRGDLSLEYAAEQAMTACASQNLQATVDATLGIKPGRWLAIAGTLAMVFSGPDTELDAFDAYTNIDLWTPNAELPLPEVTGVGRIHLAQPLSGTDRIDMGVIPRFQYCEREGRLRIELANRSTRHYQVSRCLVVGVDGDALASLDVTNLRVE